jgi:diguanylate cyclase (GGDEF)-like protein/putative nucleotidyltransferase with HDIG domain
MDASQRTIAGFSPRLFAFVAGVVLLGVGAVAVSGARIAADPPGARTSLSIALFFGLSVIADLHPVPLDDKGSEVSLAFVFLIAARLIFGWQYAVPMAAFSILLPMLLQHSRPVRALFNSGAYALAAAGSGITRIFGSVETHGIVRMTIYAFVGGLLFTLLNVALVSGAVAMSKGLRYRTTILNQVRYSAPTFAIMAFLAALAANLWTVEPVLLVLLTGPLFALSLYQRTALRSRLAVRDANTDNLTGLGNHRAYQAALRERIAEAERNGAEFSLCIVDVDDFKRINDTYGHQVGDDVLAALAEILRHARDGVAYRCGGDEFAILFPGNGTAAFERITEVQDAVAGLGLTPVTVSVGIAAYPTQAAEADGLQRMADGALYWSKHHGKNRSFVYSPKIVRIHSAKELEWETERMARLRAAKNIVRFVDAKDPSTANHSETVSALAGAIAKELGLDDSTVDQLALAGLLHDIGKIGIPDVVLQAPRPLTPEEFESIKAHPALGYSLLEGLGIAPIDEWVLHHHENWNGSGYPDRLRGDEIPLGARIIRVADAFEAMTANRPYRAAQSIEYALAELRAHAGTRFEVSVVAALESYLATASAGDRLDGALSFAFA